MNSDLYIGHVLLVLVRHKKKKKKKNHFLFTKSKMKISIFLQNIQFVTSCKVGKNRLHQQM